MNNEPATPIQRSRWKQTAITLGVLGGVSWGAYCWNNAPYWIAAPILGAILLDQVYRPLAWWRRLVRGLCLAGGIFIVCVFFSALSAARQIARAALCLNHLKEIRLAIAMYSQDHEDRIPRRFEDLRPYNRRLDQLLICPAAKDRKQPSYELLLGGHIWEGSNELNSIVVTESWLNHQYIRNELYGDGRVEQKGRNANAVTKCRSAGAEL